MLPVSIVLACSDFVKANWRSTLANTIFCGLGHENISTAICPLRTADSRRAAVAVNKWKQIV